MAEPRDVAEELTESWINGNRSHVWDELMKMPTPDGLHIVACISANLRLAGEGGKAFIDYVRLRAERARND